MCYVVVAAIAFVLRTRAKPQVQRRAKLCAFTSVWCTHARYWLAEFMDLLAQRAHDDDDTGDADWDGDDEGDAAGRAIR